MSNGTTNNDSESPRLCHVIKVDDFDGYGFNLHAEKGKPGQYIGKVDEGSPAEKAGLKQGDRIIEVNGANIANESHKQVVARIKALPNETKLLVVTPGPEEILPNLDEPDTKMKTEDKIEDANKNEIKTENGNGNINTDIMKHSESGNGKISSDIMKQNEPAPLKLKIEGKTVAEMKAELAARKRVDPKKVPMDLKAKYEIAQKL